MRILIAPNAFKNSLDAAGVALAIKEGLELSAMQCTLRCFPVGDGGDGTGKLLLNHFGGEEVVSEVHDPLGRSIHASLGLIDSGKTAVIEMANASGLRLLGPNERNPLRASSFGTGEMISRALDRGVSKIILCIGGSATVDGGVGILQALGFRFLNEAGQPLTDLPTTLTELGGIDGSNVDKRIGHCKLILLCDVENVLLGKQGAAAVFGPQKGADGADVRRLEAALTKLRDVALLQTGRDVTDLKRGGAAGGIAAGLAAFLNAELVNGIDYFLAITGFDDALEKVDLVVTGEGSIDEQTLQGKGPMGVAEKAKQKKVPVIALGGSIQVDAMDSLHRYFDILLSINPGIGDVSKAIIQTRENLVRTAKAIGDLLAIGRKIVERCSDQVG